MSDEALPPTTPPSPRSGRSRGGMTLAQVAALAGVSSMSASRALNSPDKVTPQIRERVLEAVRATGYVANRLAGGLAGRRSRLVAAVVPSITGPVFQPVVQALAAHLAAAGYELVLGQSGYEVSEDDSMLRTLIGRRPDGIVLIGVTPSPAGRQVLAAAGIPVVQAWDLVPDPVDATIGFSHAEVSQVLAAHMAERGRRHLGFIAGANSRGRERGQKLRNIALGKQVPPGLLSVLREATPAPGTAADGRAALARLLKKQPALDAVLCTSDVVAAGVLAEARAQGRRVPQDIAVAGFGDLPFSDSLYPSLTTVTIDSDFVGRAAARYIVETTEGRMPPRLRSDVGFRIVQREST